MNINKRIDKHEVPNHMFIEERHKAILQLIRANGRIAIGDIQERFGVSLDSARRDLRILEEKGLLKRTHGGAIQSVQVRPTPGAWKERNMRALPFTDNYLVIARTAAQLIQPGDVVFLGTSSLAFAMTRYLPQNIDYTLVIASATLADELKLRENIHVYLAGGRMTHQEAAPFEDSFAVAFVSNLHFDLSLITGDGLDADFGFSHCDDNAATLLRAVLGNSRKNVLMMPKQKVGVKGFVKVCDAGAFDTLITDWDAVEDQLERIREQGVEVNVAERE